MYKALKIILTLILVVVLTFLTVFLTGCGEPPPKFQKGDSIASRDNIRYFKDERTKLCFAEVGMDRYDNYSFTYVPCENIEKNVLTNPSPSPTISPYGRN